MARRKETIIFNIIRFVAAIMVMAGHMAYIGGYTLSYIMGRRNSGARSKNLLLIGGFLLRKAGNQILIRYGI